MSIHKPFRLLILGLVLILWGVPGLALASWSTTPPPATKAPTGLLSVTLSPSADNTLYEEPTGALSNGKGQYFFVGRTNQITDSIRRGVIRFDLAGNIPASATIVGAMLYLTMSKTAAGDEPVELHRLTADWGEGNSSASGDEGRGATATPDSATWFHQFYSSIFWTAPGGDFAVTASATTTVSGIGPYAWNAPGMVSDVQSWLETPSTNDGWLLLGNETTPTTAKRFNTRENTLDTRPVLVVTYTLPHSVFLPIVLK